MLPPFCFPTKVLIIDDDSFALEAMSTALAGRNFIVECSESVANIPKIDKRNYSDLRKIFIKVSTDYYKQDTKLVRISNNEIHKLMYSSKRFELFSVIVVDYKMPIMNGIELINILNNELPIKKILITGDNQSQVMAIDAFNNKVIDGFINKRDMDKLPDLVQSLSQRFFEDFFSNFMDVAEYRLDVKLAEYIEGVIQEKQPAEYYPLNERGSHVLLDKGSLSSLFVEKESSIAKFLDFMKAENLDPNIYSKIYSREYMPVIHNYAVLNDNIPIRKCTRLEGVNNIYYCTFMEGGEFLDISQKKIATFENFIKRYKKN